MDILNSCKAAGIVLGVAHSLSNVDRVKALTSGQLSGILVTAEGIYDLQKAGQIKNFHILADHKATQHLRRRWRRLTQWLLSS